MKTIGIRLADGSFYSIMADGVPGSKTLGLTTVKDNQTRVLVDMYRSATGTMEDAEYIDSLQIENLVAHPRGVVDISLRLSLDEDNRLSADMVDRETGGTSNASISLVSRTVEERLAPAEYEVIRAPAGGGLLAAMERMNKEESAGLEGAAESTADATVAADDEPPAAADAALPAEDNPFALDDTLENPFSDAAEAAVLPDFAPPDFDEVFPAEPSADTEADAAVLSDFELPDFDGSVALDDAPASADEIEELDLTPPGAEDETGGDFALAEAAADSSGAEKAESVVFDDEPFLTAPVADEAEPLDDFELPDFGDGADSAGPLSEKTAEFQADAADGGGSEPPAGLTAAAAESDADSGADGSAGNSDAFDDLEIPDFPDFGETEGTETMCGRTDDAAERYERDDAPSGGISFSGLYDKETVEGNSAADDSDDVKKKTKAPVIICVVCAIICILATLLVLFILPSKYNLLRKGESAEQRRVRELPEEPSPEPKPAAEPAKPQPEIVEAKEDEVVVVAEPEKVVPEPPAKPDVKPESIVYKIKWGDTLWDIADAYYKNPWRYHMIARHNNIKDPDYIISGTTIELPAE